MISSRLFFSPSAFALAVMLTASPLALPYGACAETNSAEQKISQAKQPEDSKADASQEKTVASTVDAPENSIQRKTELFNIDAAWPVVGISSVDEESAAFVKTLVESFEKETTEVARELAEENASSNADEAGGQEERPSMFPYELSVEYDVTRPSARAISIVWNVWSFTGGAHGALDIAANNYAQPEGTPLLLANLFANPEKALELFCQISRQRLTALKTDKQDDPDTQSFLADMLQTGTEPVAENFQTFSLLPDGLRIYFQPYQVAPWVAGPQTVDVSLDEIKEAGPRLEYWSK